MRRLALLPLFSLVFFPTHALGHGGGLDSNGGHHDRKRGGYHCHREPCFSIPREAEEKQKKAKQRKPALKAPSTPKPDGQ